MSEEIAIRVDNVSKDFVLPHEKVSSVKGLFTGVTRRHRGETRETQHALKDISFEINKGEFFGIVGRNGSGKSTLLKILAGIYQPTKGSVSVRGKLVPFIELGVGFNPELTGRENVYLNGAMLGFSETEVDSMYKDIVEFAELERFMDQKLKNYSSGMQVRLAFSMAVRADADILLIDEVLAVGDADFQRKCFDFFKQLKKNKKTVVFVSHEMDAIREYCDRAVLIEQSRIIKSGNSSEVSQEYSKLFLADETLERTGEESRWGDGAIVTQKVEVEVSEKALKIMQTLMANQDVSSPIAGIRVRDFSDKEVTGSNTKIEQKRLPNLKKGAQIRLVWEMPNILSDGNYHIDPAILHDDGITVADWWDDATSFKVKKSRRLPYAIDPSFRLTVGDQDD